MMALRPWTADFETRRIHSDASGARFRVLVDRLWLRGVKKSDGDEWLKHVAAST